MGGEWRERPLAELTDNFDGIRVPVKEADRRAGETMPDDHDAMNSHPMQPAV